MLPDGVVIDIVQAEYVGDYKLKLVFNDGIESVVDLEPFLRNSRNPLIRVYLDQEKFAHFRVEWGDLIWDDYSLCFPIADLYENRI